MRSALALAVSTVLALGAGVTRARAQDEVVQTSAPDAHPWALLADLGATLMSRSSTASTSLELARAQALGVGIDRRAGDLHLFARGEANAWRERRDDGTHDFVLTFNLGLGVGLDYGGGRLRSSLAVGATLLALPADVDSAGAVGVFTDIRPVAYTWTIAPGVRLGVVPLSLALSVPVLTGIPLVSIQYRTTIFAERDL